MYGFSIEAQGYALFMFLGIGFLLGILYDIIRIIRLSVSKKRICLYIADAVFVLLCVAVTFCASLIINYGEMHFYMFISELTGFFIYYFTFDSFVRRFAEKAVAVLKKIYTVLFGVFSVPVKIFVSFICFFAGIFKKPTKKIKYFFNLLLQRIKQLVYNIVGRLGLLKKGKRASSDEEK